MKDTGNIHNLPALNTENWGCLDMDGDDFYVDLFGIQWESEGENTVLFPDKDVNEDADIMEVNTIVSADAEVGDVSFCRSEGCIEEEDKLDQGHDSDNVFSRTFSTVSCCSSASSASSLGLLDSCIDLFPYCCNCVDDICSSNCIDNNGFVICINSDCMNYTGSEICINCLFELKLVAERPGQTCSVINTFWQSKVCLECNQVSDEQVQGIMQNRFAASLQKWMCQEKIHIKSLGSQGTIL